MAGHLSASTVAALKGQDLSIEDFRGRAWLVAPTAAEIEITSRVKSFGRIKIEATNWHPDERRELAYPTVSVELHNHDGYFTQGLAGSVWSLWRPQAWAYHYRREVLVNGVWTKLMEFQFPVLDLSGAGDLATLEAVHRLRIDWARPWNHEWDGFQYTTSTVF